MVFSMLKFNLILALLFVNISVFADERVAPVTCAVISETTLDQSAYRVKEVNEARSKLNLDPYLEGDDEILLSIKYDLCILLIMDFEEYKKESKILVLAEKEEIERRRKAREKAKEELRRELEAKAKAKEELRRELEAKEKASFGEKERLKYVQIITRRISENWYRPPSFRLNMQTLLKITLTHAGKVQNVQIVDTSGDRGFDLSAKEATLKSEFPEIQELSPSEYTKYFREINILFDPQNLRL
jgi:TonB family protein